MHPSDGLWALSVDKAVMILHKLCKCLCIQISEKERNLCTFPNDYLPRPSYGPPQPPFLITRGFIGQSPILVYFLLSHVKVTLIKQRRAYIGHRVTFI